MLCYLLGFEQHSNKENNSNGINNKKYLLEFAGILNEKPNGFFAAVAEGLQALAIL